MRLIGGSWGKKELPLVGRVVVLDDGPPMVGLSAMQMDNLGVKRGTVRLQFEDRFCDADVWNAFGPDSLEGDADIRITSEVAEKLGCGEGDLIIFQDVLVRNKPVNLYERVPDPNDLF